MKKTQCLILCLFVLLVTPLRVLPQERSVAAVNRKEVVKKARSAYYSLQRHDFAEFRCDVTPRWDDFFKSVPTDAVGRDKLLPTLKQAHFQLLVGPDGASTVSHDIGSAPQTEEIAERVRRTVTGLEQILTGFMHTWAPFVVTSPLPEVDSEYQLTPGDGGYTLKYSEGGRDEVTTILTSDYAITEMSVHTKEFEGEVRPIFSKDHQELLLKSYDGSYKASNGGAQHILVEVGYQVLEGINLPAAVSANVDVPNGTIPIAMDFTNCKVKKK